MAALSVSEPIHCRLLLQRGSPILYDREGLAFLFQLARVNQKLFPVRSHAERALFILQSQGVKQNLRRAETHRVVLRLYHERHHIVGVIDEE